MNPRYLILVASYQQQNLAVLLGVGFGLAVMFIWWLLSRMPWPRVRSFAQIVFFAYVLIAIYLPVFTLGM